MLSISNTARMVRLRNKSSLSYRSGILNFSPLRAITNPPAYTPTQNSFSPVPVPHLFKMVSNTNLRLSSAKGPRSLVLAPKYYRTPHTGTKVAL